ncbi:DEAD/DEAH box helicase [Pectobacterium polaris]|uniref:DEAD/DEAH box helicase n=1 Tax=Pectobacterium polaris TaxID=2042057 RepID=UPI0015E810B9|nr:DEAD/DEAH box helicase [Pectobacterium polaris]
MLNDIIRGDGIEEVMDMIIVEFHSNGPVSMSSLETLSLIKHFHPQKFKVLENKLLSTMGLFFKTNKPKSFLEIVYKDLGDVIEAQYGNTFTPVQARAYKSILDKKFYSFSAPTSTGKSHLFRELIKKIDNDIVIVVPSRALIAEFYSAVVKIVENDVLVLQFIENINQNNIIKRVFIITPERGVELFKYFNDFDIGLFLFDEAQIADENVRGITFDAFVRRTERVFPNAKKVFAHPFVANPEAQHMKHNFNEMAGSDCFEQNNVGKIFVALEDDGSYSFFSPFKKTADYTITNDIIKDIILAGGSALIYISKSKIYNNTHIESFNEYIELCPSITNDKALLIIESLEDYIGSSDSQLGKKSSFIELMKKGVVVHHGSMPLKARLLIEDFVREGFAKICFATSTLNQGINMPFDCVLIDNFRDMGHLTLKNLIGRSGRSTSKNEFDFGFTIINRRNVRTFVDRISEKVNLNTKSALDDDFSNVPPDYRDLVEAIKSDTFDDDLHLTKKQVDRIVESNLNKDIEFILDKLIRFNKTITAKEYYQLGSSARKKLKDRIKVVYCSHLKNEQLSRSEQVILSTAIPILLWKVQGKSFSETVSLRHAFLTERDERRKLLRSLRSREIERSEYIEKLSIIKIATSFRAEKIPNSSLRLVRLFPIEASVVDFNYDMLVYDTYDYLDKVISLSLADPLSAALTIYYESTGDERSKVLKNYIRYGTNDEKEIWLLKYGFDPEDISWLLEIVSHIDEDDIIFKDISGLPENKMEIIKRFLN